jgi:hypothetical protein
VADDGVSATVGIVQRRGTVPIPLLVGVVVGICGSAAVAMASLATDDGFEGLMRWLTFSHGCSVAETLCTAIALFAVAKRAVGIPRVVALIAAWVSVGLLGWLCLQDVVMALEPSQSSYRYLVGYGWKMFGLAHIGVMVLLGVASRVWTRSWWVIVLAGLGVLASFLTTSVPVIGPLLRDAVGDSLGVYYPLRDIALAAGLLAMVHAILREVPPPTPEPQLAALAFRRAAIALMGRIVAAIVLAVLGIGLIRSTGAIKALVLLAPAITVLMTLMFAWAMLDVERAALAEMPRVRLTIGAALLAWSAGIQLQQAAETYSRLGDSGFGPSEQWTIVAPIVAVVGGIFIVSAIYSFAVSRGNERLRASAGARGPIYAILSLAPTLLPLAMAGAHSAGAIIGLAVIAIVCAIAAIVALAGLMSLTAEALGHAPVLPEARLR